MRLIKNIIPASMKIVPPIESRSPTNAFLFSTNVELIISVDVVSVFMEIIIALMRREGSEREDQ